MTKSKQLQTLLETLLDTIPRKVLWQKLRIRVYDLYMILGDLDPKVLDQLLAKKRIRTKGSAIFFEHD